MIRSKVPFRLVLPICRPAKPNGVTADYEQMRKRFTHIGVARGSGHAVSQSIRAEKHRVVLSALTNLAEGRGKDECKQQSLSM